MGKDIEDMDIRIRAYIPSNAEHKIIPNTRTRTMMQESFHVSSNKPTRWMGVPSKYRKQRKEDLLGSFAAEFLRPL